MPLLARVPNQSPATLVATTIRLTAFARREQTAIMKLVEEGRLTLDDRVAPLIADLTPAPGASVDASPPFAIAPATRM